ncbi:MAG: NADH-quinone oxidoreductase subunit K [Chlamydiota bacterium]
MPIDILIVIFAFFSFAAYLLLDKSLLNIICGFVLLSSGANVFLLSTSGDPYQKVAPLLSKGIESPFVDPLPQAMILTAIVIGLGLLALIATIVYLIAASSKGEGGKQ